MQNHEEKIWTEIRNDLDKLPSTSTVPRKILSYLQNRIRNLDFDIDIQTGSIHFNKQELHLKNRKKLFMIFEMFLKNKSSKISRGKMVQKIYSTSLEGKSQRQKNCYNHNIVKLLSRARFLAKKTFSDEVMNTKIVWFPYDPSTQTWQLYTLKEEECHFSY